MEEQAIEKDNLKERLEDQINWYASKSQSARRRSRLFGAIEIGVAVTIPLLVIFGATYRYALYATALSGLIVVLIAALRNIYQLEEDWIRYRLIAESLRRERDLFPWEGAAYSSSADPVRDLVQRVEGLVTAEHSEWGKTVLADTHGGGGGSKD